MILINSLRYEFRRELLSHRGIVISNGMLSDECDAK